MFDGMNGSVSVFWKVGSVCYFNDEPKYLRVGRSCPNFRYCYSILATVILVGRKISHAGDAIMPTPGFLGIGLFVTKHLFSSVAQLQHSQISCHQFNLYCCLTWQLVTRIFSYPFIIYRHVTPKYNASSKLHARFIVYFNLYIRCHISAIRTQS
jgi:hypothetical protein